MRNSLRTRLLLRTLIGASCIFVLTGIGIYWVASRTLRTEFDEVLRAKAHSFALLVEEEGKQIEFEGDLRLLSEFRPGPDAEFLEVRRLQGPIALRSPSLAGREITWPNEINDTPRLYALTLPDGRLGRSVSFTFHPLRGADETANPKRKSNTTLEIILAKGTERLRAQTTKLATLLAVAVAGALVALALILNQSVRKGLAPLQSLASDIERIDANHLSTQIQIPDPVSELATVTDKLNDLLARLKGAFDREKALTADVAHELRTPLSGLRTTIDVALLRDRTSGEYSEMLRRSLGVIVHTQDLVDSMLTLARADAGLTDLTRESVNWKELVSECWAPLDQRASEKGLSISFELDPQTEITSNRGACSQILSNLLENAVTYANPGGRIVVRTGEQNGAPSIRITNTGCALSEEQMQHVFDRFWRGDSARTQDGVHHGLGLALVQRLVTMMGGHIKASCEDALFCIDLSLPST